MALTLTRRASFCAFRVALPSRIGAVDEIRSRQQSGEATATEDKGAPGGEMKRLSDLGFLPMNMMPGPQTVSQTMPWYLENNRLRFDLRHVIHQKMAEEYGPVFQEKLPNMRIVVVTDPEEYAKITRVDGKMPQRMELGPMAHHRYHKGWGAGLVNSNGEEWFEVRQAVAPLILKPKEVSNYIPGMDAVAVDFVQHMQRRWNERTGVVQGFQNDLFLWAMESVSLFLIEKRFGSLSDPPPPEARKFIQNVIGFFSEMQFLLYNVPLYRFMNTIRYKKFASHADVMLDTMRGFVDEHVSKFERNKNDPNVDSKEEAETFIGKLLTKRGMDRKRTIETVVDLYTGAVETTSNTVGWILYLLAENPESQTKAHEEVVRILEKHSGKITVKALGEMDYLKAVLRETFRLYPITYSTSRLIAEPTIIGGYQLPAGTHCQASLYTMGRNTNLFVDPLEFRPERWTRGEDALDPTTKAFASLPFGHGPRMCIGRRIAEQEIYIVLARILESFEVSYAGTSPPEGILKLVMVPKEPMALRFHRRF